MTEEKLMPCPFCGGPADMRGHKAPEFWVGCSKIGCKATTEGFGSKERAIAAWNTRPAREEVSGEEVERVFDKAVELAKADGASDDLVAFATLRIYLRAAMNPKPAEAASGAGDHEPGCEHSHCPIRICACPPATPATEKAVDLSDGEIYSRASFDSADHKRGFLEGMRFSPRAADVAGSATPTNPERLVEQKAAEAIRKAFFTSVSGGSPQYHLSLAYQSIDEMHEAEDAIKAWAKSVLEPKA